MDSLANHLIRRGVADLHTRVTVTGGQEKAHHLPAWSIPIFVVTWLVFSFGYIAISYTYGELIPTLAAVEAPSSTVILRTPPEDSKVDEANASLIANDEKIEQNVDQEILLVKQKALTSSFCTIKRHLRARGGRGARFRGFGIYMLNFLIYTMLSGLVGGLSGNPNLNLPAILLQSLIWTALTPLTLLWNHIILSEPNGKSAFKRIAPRAVWKKALLPTFLSAFLTSIIGQGFIYIAVRFWMLRQLPFQAYSPTQHIISFLFVIATGLVFFFCVQVPAEIAMVRVRASLLSTEETPIIPFDRTFNGHVVAVEDGGSGMLNLKQGLMSCDLRTFLRVAGAYAKMFLILTWFIIIGFGVLLFEVRAIATPELWAELRKAVGSM